MTASYYISITLSIGLVLMQFSCGNYKSQSEKELSRSCSLLEYNESKEKNSDIMYPLTINEVALENIKVLASKGDLTVFDSITLDKANDKVGVLSSNNEALINRHNELVNILCSFNYEAGKEKTNPGEQIGDNQAFLYYRSEYFELMLRR